MLSGIRTDRIPRLREMAGCDVAVGISSLVATPVSRGWVAIVSDDPQISPQIHLQCLREEADLQRMKEGLRAAWRIYEQKPFAACIERVVHWNRSSIESDRAMESLIHGTLRSVWHAVGSLRMGPDADVGAVVDQRGALRGCHNLTVADASIMPSITSAPPALAVLVIAERIAAHLRGAESS